MSGNAHPLNNSDVGQRRNFSNPRYVDTSIPATSTLLIYMFIVPLVAMTLWAFCQILFRHEEKTAVRKKSLPRITGIVAPIVTPLPHDFHYTKYSSGRDTDETDVMESSDSSLVSLPFQCKSIKAKIEELRSSSVPDIVVDDREIIGGNLLIKTGCTFQGYNRVIHLLLTNSLKETDV